MTAFLHHFAFEFKTGLRNSTSLFMNYLFPLGVYAILGLIMTQVNPMFTETLLPAMMVFVIMGGTILGLPSPLVETRNAGIYRSYKINGVPAASIITIPVLTTGFHALIVATVVALTATPFFDGVAPTQLAPSCRHRCADRVHVQRHRRTHRRGLGQQYGHDAAFTGHLPALDAHRRDDDATQHPAESVQSFAGLLPSAHAMQALEGLAYGRETVFNPTTSLLILAASGLLAFGLAIYLFNWDSRNQTRRGHPLMALIALVPYLIGMML